MTRDLGQPGLDPNSGAWYSLWSLTTHFSCYRLYTSKLFCIKIGHFLHSPLKWHTLHLFHISSILPGLVSCHLCRGFMSSNFFNSPSKGAYPAWLSLSLNTNTNHMNENSWSIQVSSIPQSIQIIQPQHCFDTCVLDSRYVFKPPTLVSISSSNLVEHWNKIKRQHLLHTRVHSVPASSRSYIFSRLGFVCLRKLPAHMPIFMFTTVIQTKPIDVYLHHPFASPFHQLSTKRANAGKLSLFLIFAWRGFRISYFTFTSHCLARHYSIKVVLVGRLLILSFHLGAFEELDPRYCFCFILPYCT